jgi:hypothetical protein
VTEVTAGSGFFKPHLFDYFSNPHMRQLEPAAFFALEVTRRPAPDLSRASARYVARARGRQVRPTAGGLELLAMEMCGEGR